MDPPDARSAVEEQIRAAFEGEDYVRAAQCLIEQYGHELLSFMSALLTGPDEADDAFQELCEQIWRSLPSFRSESTFRTWSYALARHTAYRELRRPDRRRERRIPLSSAPEIAAMAERVRTTTVRYLRTEVKEEVARLRESLPPEERELMILRINRKMAWTEIADVIDGEAATGRSAAETKRRAATLRKRFQRAKERLRAQVAGKYPPND